MKTNNLESLQKLSGMAYHGGHPPEHWIALVGVDPRTCPEVEISASGLCYWTKRAERICRAHWNAVQFNYAMLTETTYRPQ